MNRRNSPGAWAAWQFVAENALGVSEEPASPPAPTRVASAAKPALFADDPQFWFETQRAFGAAEYGGSLFGEVLAVATASHPATTTAGTTPGIRRLIASQKKRPINWRAITVSVPTRAFLCATSYNQSSEFFLHG